MIPVRKPQPVRKREKTHQTAVVLIPPREVWRPVQAIRERYDRQFPRWMPHITLVYPFHPVREFARDLPHLRQACEAARPFRVELTELRWFHHREQGFTLWLAPQPRQALVDLQRWLVRAVPDCDDLNHFAQGFEPHLSVGQVHTKSRMEKVIQRLQEEWQPIGFAVERICLIARGDPPKDQFQVVEEIALGAG